MKHATKDLLVLSFKMQYEYGLLSSRSKVVWEGFTALQVNDSPGVLEKMDSRVKGTGEHPNGTDMLWLCIQSQSVGSP